MYIAKLKNGTKKNFEDLMDGLDYLNMASEGILERDGIILAVKNILKIKGKLKEAVII